MATFKKGNMWLADPEPDVWLVTTNSVLTKAGRLVMGGGAALQATEHFPGCNRWFGAMIRETCGSGGFYGILIHPDHPLGAFQTKRHWKHNSSVSLIYDSAVALTEWLARDKTLRVSLNFPGIGLGGLRKEDVLPIVTQLPDRVTIWEWSSEYHSEKEYRDV